MKLLLILALLTFAPGSNTTRIGPGAQQADKQQPKPKIPRRIAKFIVQLRRKD